MARFKSGRALRKALAEHVVDNGATLYIRLGKDTYKLEDGLYIGAAVGEKFAYVATDDKDYIVELDKANKLAITLVDNPTNRLEEIAEDLLPEPEPPAEVKAANELLASLPRLPKGWRYGTDSRGNIAVVEDGAPGVTAAHRTRSPKGSAAANAKPRLEKGLMLSRNKDGLTYAVDAIDKVQGFVLFKPVDGGDTIEQKALMGNGSDKTVPIFWRNWQVVEA